MTVESLTAGSGGWLQANPAAFEQAARALVATAGAIQQVIARRDAALQALTANPTGWTGQASQQFASAWTRRRAELHHQMATHQDASVVYQRFSAALAEAQQAWQRLTEQATQAGAILTPEGVVDVLGPPPVAAALALSDELRAIRTQAEAITTQITDADRQAAAQLSELSRRDPRPEVEDTTNLPALLHAGMRGRTDDTPLPPGTDPNVVAAWFAALSPQLQQRLVQNAPNLIGNLNGLPPEVRDRANRLAISRALPGVQAELGAVRAELAALAGQPATARDALSQAAERSALEQEIAALERRKATFDNLLALDDGHTILAFSPEGNGQVAVAVGDITAAGNVGVLVPGMDTTIDKYDGYLGHAERLRVAADRLLGTRSTAMVAWLGYDAPQGLAQTLNPFSGYPHASEGAPRLAEFTDGLMTTHQGDPRLTVVGHSYGSSTMSLAAAEYGLPADKAVFIGSTGALGAETIADLNLADGAEVWAARNLNDVVADVPEAVLGIDPINKDFGANVFQADDKVPVWNEFAHGANLYMNADTSPSFSNIVRIITDRSEEVDLGVHRFLFKEQP